MTAESVKSPSPIDRYVGARVKLRRREIGMSQEDLAERLGLTYQQIQKYEKGTNRIGASRLHQIAAILGVPVPWFFFGAAKELGGAENDDFAEATDVGDEITIWLATDEARDLIAGFKGIQEPGVKRAFLEMVRAIARGSRGDEAAPLDRAPGRPKAESGVRRRGDATDSPTSR